MSDSTCKNAPGSGSGGIQSSEELGMGRFNNDDAASVSPKAPSFKPDQLNAFCGTGYELIKLHTPRDLDAKGNKIGKAPYKGWRVNAALAVGEAVEAMDTGHNVGVRLGVCDLVVDVDPRNFADGDNPVKRLEKLIGRSLDAWPTVVTGSGGRHHYMTVPEGFVGMETHTDFPGIEFKRHGRQVVAPGSVHPDTGQPYLWIDDDFATPVNQAGAAPQALLDLIVRRVTASGGDAGDYDGEQLAQMLSGLNPEDFSDHAKWLELMMACHHATDGQGREEFIEWSTGDARYAADDWKIGRRWDSLHADHAGPKVTVRTLFKRLHDAGKGDLIPRVSAQDDFADDIEGQQLEPGADKETGHRLAAEWVWVTGAEQFISRSDCDRLSPFQFKAHHQHLWKNDILASVWNGKLPIGKFDRCVYVPGAGEIIAGGKWAGHYNTWRKGGVEPKRDDVLAQVFLDHMAYLLPDEKERGYALDYLSFLVRDDFVKIHFALLVQGKPGTGKSFIGAVAEQMVGIRNTRMVKSQELTKEFNAWQEDRQLAIIEEIMARGRIELVNELKTVITGDVLRVRRMRTDTYEVPNGLNLLCFTNHENALPIEQGDRRWLTLFSPAEPREPSYYRRLFDLLDGDEFAAAVKWMLQNRQAALEPKGMAPMTGGKAEMRRRSTGDVEQYLDELLETRATPFDFDLVRVDDVWKFVQGDFRGVRDLRGRVIGWLKAAGGQQHGRYTKADGSGRPSFMMWSLCDHDAWAEKGAAGRADAWQAFHGGSTD